jgi:hypothetical protein
MTFRLAPGARDDGSAGGVFGEAVREAVAVVGRDDEDMSAAGTRRKAENNQSQEPADDEKHRAKNVAPPARRESSGIPAETKRPQGERTRPRNPRGPSRDSPGSGSKDFQRNRHGHLAFRRRTWTRLCRMRLKIALTGAHHDGLEATLTASPRDAHSPPHDALDPPKPALYPVVDYLYRLALPLAGAVLSLD